MFATFLYSSDIKNLQNLVTQIVVWEKKQKVYVPENMDFILCTVGSGSIQISSSINYLLLLESCEMLNLNIIMALSLSPSSHF